MGRGISWFLDRAPQCLALANLGALASALTAQYAFGLLPCILCLYQRVPFTLVALLSLGALCFPDASPRLRRNLLALCALALVVNSGIASFHVGVEHHWWAGTDECRGEGNTLPASSTDLLAAMSKPAVVRCDEPQWALFGITMAGYNVAYSLALAFFAGWAAVGGKPPSAQARDHQGDRIP